MSVMSPPPALCNLSALTMVKLCTLGVFALGVSLVSRIVMISACVSWISSLSSSNWFLIPFMLTCSMIRFLSLLLLGMCPCVVSVVLWSSFVCLWGCRGILCGGGGCRDCDACADVCVTCVSTDRVWCCEVDGNAGVRDWRGVVSAGPMGGTRGSGIVSSAADVLWMSVVHGMRGVGGVCEMFMCLARGGVDGEWVSEWKDWLWALPILWEQGECWSCVCVWVAVV